MNKKYRLVKDAPDSRDHMFAIPIAPTLPAMTDLRPGMPPIYDQGQLGSCSGNAVAAAFQFDQMKEKIQVWNPSRLFIYYNERLFEGTVNEDAGAQLRDGIRAIATYGVCSEQTWVYDTSKFTIKPSDQAYDEARLHKALHYQRVGQDLTSLRQVLSAGFPIVVGIMLYEAFESDEVAMTGIVPMPNTQMEQCLGGHAVVVVGYDDSKKMFIMRNSWGPDWGDKGYFYLPYEYLTNPNLGMDFWVVTQIQ